MGGAELLERAAELEQLSGVLAAAANGRGQVHRSHRRADTVHRGGAVLTAMIPSTGTPMSSITLHSHFHSNLRRRLRFVADGEHPGNREHRAVGPGWIGVAQLVGELRGKLLGVVG